MPNKIREYYGNYMSSVENFERFHNQVINMPRDNFSTSNLKKIKKLCAYISLLGKERLSQVINYKEIMELIRAHLHSGNYPSEELRDRVFEERYFNFADSIDELYEREGRMFRHWMGILAFFGIVKDEQNRTQKLIDFDTMEEVLSASDKNLLDMFRNRMLGVNINSNSYIANLNGITLNQTADYKPAINILKYLNEIGRPATMFEVSLLLGRIDEVQTENEIFTRAIEVGRTLPTGQDEQIQHFFGNMNWKSGDIIFSYAASQQPFFKFKTFILCLETCGFITINQQNNTMTNTDYSNELLRDTIPFELLDLENLLRKIDDDNASDNELARIILRNRTEAINRAIQEDTDLVIKFNKRAIRNPIIKNGKRRRNKIIAELAKIKANYCDEITGAYTFIGQNGNGYVEAHRMIEFSTENGPDITDNLVCLNPDNHSKIHHGSSAVVEDTYITLRTVGVATLERFKRITNIYRCLTEDHITVLHNKKLISLSDKDELLTLVRANGVDPLFLQSLNTPATRGV